MKFLFLFLLLFLLLATASNANASCLDDIADFAERICGDIKSSGNSDLTEANGELKAEVTGIVRRIVGDAGGSFNVNHLTKSYENVLREDLAKELFSVRDCRIKMVEVGRKESCAVGATPSAKQGISRTCSYVGGPKAGTEQYFPPSVPIIPARIGDPCHDGMGSWGYAVADD